LVIALPKKILVNFSQKKDFRPDRRTKCVSPEETQAQSPHYCFAQLSFSQFPAK
jgi:hypothetical protein